MTVATQAPADVPRGGDYAMMGMTGDDGMIGMIENGCINPQYCTR